MCDILVHEVVLPPVYRKSSDKIKEYTAVWISINANAFSPPEIQELWRKTQGNSKREKLFVPIRKVIESKHPKLLGLLC